MAITTVSIAKQIGVTQATVSRALRDNPRIAAETREKIQAYARQVGYRPNRVAQNLVNRRTQMIGIQLPSFCYDHWLSVIRHLDETARKSDYHLLLSTPGVWQEEKNEIERLCECRVDGLIISPRVSRKLWRLYKTLISQNMPFVFLGNTPNDHYYSVIDDNQVQASMAVEHLIGLGHTRIAFLHGVSSVSGCIERRRGYFNTLRNHGLDLRAHYVGIGRFDLDQSRLAVEKMLSLPEPPTAIYCSSDSMALGAILAVENAGRRVPDDVAIVGHGDDLPYSWFNRIPLTTIRQPREQLAEIAMAKLFALLQGKEPEEKVTRLPGTLIVRASSGGTP